MKSDQFSILQQLRHFSEFGSGWLTALAIVIGVVVVLFTVISSLALPIYLVRVNLRLAELERRLDALAGRTVHDRDR